MNADEALDRLTELINELANEPEPTRKFILEMCGRLSAITNILKQQQRD